MSSLIAIAEHLGEHPPVAMLASERCLRLRDRESTCSACAEVCPTQAITIRAATVEEGAPHGSVGVAKDAGPRINSEACLYCGACVTICPTNALLALPPFDDEGLIAQIEDVGAAAQEWAPVQNETASEQGAAQDEVAETSGSAAEKTEEIPEGPEKVSTGISQNPAKVIASTSKDPASTNASSSENTVSTISLENARQETVTPSPPPTTGFVCKRLAQTLNLDTSRVIALPCLVWIDTALLVHMACSGAKRIAVPLDACPSCEWSNVANLVHDAVANAQRICSLAGLDATFEASDGPVLRDLELAPERSEPDELSRRVLFAQAGASLLDATQEAAKHQLEAFVGSQANDDTQPKPDTRRWQLLDDLHATGLANSEAVIPCVLAPRVSIDPEYCSGCSQCALFCPTEALKKIGRASGGRTLLEFDPALCRDCGVCEATCRYGALTCTETLTADELFALGPQEIFIPKRRVLPERRRNT